LKTSSRSLLTLCLAVLPVLAQAPPSDPDLARKLEALTRELEQVKGQVTDLQRPRPEAEAATILGGYGEVNFRAYTQGDRSRNQADVRRLVLGVSHRFDDRTRIVTELEVEHAVSSADDKGEVEIEQAYLEHQLNEAWGLRAGLFLMPFGLLNEHHEPNAFYGVDRNFVETAIIPSTWREGGVQLYASFQNGLAVQAGVSTGFNLGKWDAGSTEGRQAPLASVHQELSLARSHDFAVFAALNWRGLPGLLLGGSWFSGGASQAQPGLPAMTVALWDLHARWTPGAWDLSALYAAGGISHSAAFNASLEGANLVPERFHGWYGQAAYHLWSSGSYALAPFVRYEATNTAAAFASLGPLSPAPAPTQGVWTVGANFNLAPSVVIKADLQRFRQDRGNDRVNLGFGWSF
jgi:hypothetical protein